MLAPARIVVASLIVAVLVGPLSSVGQADGGCGGAGRPACTILRPDTVEPASPRVVPVDAGECIVLVGGLGSEPEMTRAFFRPLVAPFVGDPRFTIHTFGGDRGETHRYRTYGAIAENALELRELVRDLSDECTAIDVVAHSMGGAVADRAFSLGLTAEDGVATYLPLSSPHNGVTAALAVRAPVEVDEDFAAGASWLARQLRQHDPTSDAVRDLAHIRSPRHARVPTVRQRMVHDVLVIHRDHFGRGVDVREYLPRGVSLDEVDGHSSIARNDHVRAVLERAIREHAVPPDDRGAMHTEIARATSLVIDERMADVWLGAEGVLVSAALLTKIGAAAAEALRAARDALLLIEPLPLLQVPPPTVAMPR